MSDVRLTVTPPVRETVKAWAWEGSEGLIWVPKSQATLITERHAGKDVYVLSVADWLYHKRDLSTLGGKA